MAPRLPFQIGERTVLAMTCRQCGAFKSGTEFPRYLRSALDRIAYVAALPDLLVVANGSGQPEERPMNRAASIPVWVCCGCERVFLERPAKTTHRRFTKSDGCGQTRVHGRTWSVCGPIEERRIVRLLS